LAQVGTIRYIYFRLADSNGVAVTGRVQTDFSVVFTRNTLTCADTMVISELGTGRYFASYTPSAVGSDYIEIYDSGTDTRIEDVETIETSVDQASGSGEIVILDENQGAPNALKITQVTSPEKYVLYVFDSQDWQNGNQSVSYSLGQTGLNPNGTWQSKIEVMYGTYHIVIVGATQTIVISPFLEVTGPTYSDGTGGSGEPGPTGPAGPPGQDGDQLLVNGNP
jgi:hypothetical protein